MLNDLDEGRDDTLCDAISRATGLVVTPDLVTITEVNATTRRYTPNAEGRPSLGSAPATLIHQRINFDNLITHWGRPSIVRQVYDTVGSFIAEVKRCSGILLTLDDLEYLTFPLDLMDTQPGDIISVKVGERSLAFTGTLSFKVYDVKPDQIRYTFRSGSVDVAGEPIMVGFVYDGRGSESGKYEVYFDGVLGESKVEDNVLYGISTTDLVAGTHEVRIVATRYVCTVNNIRYTTHPLTSILEITRTYWETGGYQTMGNEYDDKTPLVVAKDCYANNVTAVRLRTPFCGGGLTALPSGIFSGCIFEDSHLCLRNTGLTRLQTGLFSGATLTGRFTYPFPKTVAEVEDGVFPTVATITDMDGLFQGCKITRIPVDILESAKDTLTSLYRAFDSTLIAEIPPTLFHNYPKLTDVSSMFSSCSQLTEIPDNLFSRNTELSNAGNVFYFTYNVRRIGTGIFGGLSKLERVDWAFAHAGERVEGLDLGTLGYDMFRGCSSLNTAASAFRNCKFSNMDSDIFKDCTALEDINGFISQATDGDRSCTIPTLSDDLFINCQSLLKVEAFMEGVHLGSIGEKLFKNMPRCAEVTSLSRCFAYTDIAVIPPGLLDGCTSLENVSKLFSHCSRLVDVPDNLFTVCGKTLKDVSQCFGSTSVKTMPSNLLAQCSQLETCAGLLLDIRTLESVGPSQLCPSTVLTDLESMFSGATITSYPPTPLSLSPTANYAYLFSGSNLNTTSTMWFSKQTAITSLSAAFSGTKIDRLVSGLIPPGVSVTNMNSLCGSIYSPISIESGWFTPTDEPTNMSYAFYNTELVIPLPPGAIRLTGNINCDWMFHSISLGNGGMIDVDMLASGISAPEGGPKSYKLMFGGYGSGDHNPYLTGDPTALIRNLGLTSDDTETLFGINPNLKPK